MKYLASIKYFDGGEARLFNNETEAKNWLNDKNNNLEYETTIDVLDNKGNFVDGYVYTEAKKE